MPLPLEDIRVVSLAEQYPGPYATLLMADLGADVVLVERPGTGDPARQFPSFHAALNRNKRSVALDLKSAAGSDALKRLAARADVLLEGFRPGTMERLGLGYRDLSAINPRLVYASISGFGQDGPYRDRPAHDLSYQALAGLLFRQARSDRMEPPPDVAIGDLSSGLFTVVGVLSALHARQRTGEGTYLDVSMTDGLVSLMTVFLSPLLNGQAPAEIGAEPAYGSFFCADGRALTLSIAHEDWFWKPMCHATGMPDVADLRRPERIARADELRTRLAHRLKAKSVAEWGRLFDEAGVAWAPINDLQDVLNDPHLRSRGLFAGVQRPDGSTEHHVLAPVQFSRYQRSLRRPAPALGEHTSDVLREAGLSEAEIDIVSAPDAPPPGHDPRS